MHTALAVLWLVAASPPGTDLNALHQAVAQHNLHAQEPLPELGQGQLRDLAAGQVLGLYRVPTGERVGGTIGIVISRLSRDRLWLGAQDPHYQDHASLTMHRLQHRGSTELWYGYLALPWPFTARQWQVTTRTNRALARATSNRSWERAWKMTRSADQAAWHAVREGRVRGVQRQDYERAIYTPANNGAWSFISLDGDRTLVAFQVNTDIGGFIPAEVVARYAVHRMEDTLRQLERRAARVSEHYVGDHAPVLGGDELPIPLFDRGPELAANARW